MIMRKILFCSLLVILGNIACEDEARTIPEISGVQQAEVWVDSRDGKSYDCIEIGDQIWLAENLSYFVVENEILNCRTFGESYLSQEDFMDNVREPFKEAIRASGLQDPDGLGLLDRPSMKYPTWVNDAATLDEVIAQAEADETFTDEWIRVFKETRDSLLSVVVENHFAEAEADNGYYSEKYGLLYSYDAALKAVPSEGGWRLPEDEDWKKLERYLGMSEEEIAKDNAWRGDIQGVYLKEGSEYSIGFNALYGGGKLYVPTYDSNSDDDTYTRQGQNAYFWTSEKLTESDSIPLGMIRSVAIFNEQILRTTTRIVNDSGQPTMFSVRLVKDKN